MEDDSLFENRLIDITPRKRKVWLYVTIAIFAMILLFGSQLLRIYVDSLWYSSAGYSDVYWYKFRLGGLLFAAFFVITFIIFRLSFMLLTRLFPELSERPNIRLTTVEDIKDVNFLPYLYRPGVWVISIGAALLSAISMSQAWPDFALYLNAQQAGVADPIFNRDTSFYLFKLPVLEMLSGWLQTIAVLLFIIVAATSGYIWYLERVRNDVTMSTRRRATAAISAAGVLLALALAANTYVDRFDLLQTRNALFTGVNYTDANVRLKVMNILIIIFLISAIALAINAFSLRQLRLIFWLAASVAVVWIIGLVIIPQSVYSFSVKPNELAKESPYIEHNIQMTRQAFALDNFEVRPFVPAPTLTAEQIEANRETLDNVRLWDRRALQATLRQIQVIRTYYDFNVPDVDRYVIDGRRRQVMLAAREMNTDRLPERNWINQHLVYTHGYGVTMNTVNEFTPEGMPHLVLKNMPVESTVPEIKVTRPEIYFGEESNTHVYVRTVPQRGDQPEFNFPAPDNTESYSTYEGGAGIQVGGLLRKLALSVYLGDGTNLLFSDYINSDSRVLIHRNVRERVQKLAPFLLFDEDPYIVISREGKLFWIVDGFTYSDRYPYSTEYTAGGRGINYIRNSVKAVIDAYEGTVNFYVFDQPSDPIINAYQKIFPSLFHSKDEMPDDLREHVRYPSLLVTTQARAYLLYHIQDPQTFYNHEDLWAIATAETPAQPGAEPEPMEPYHVLMHLPGEQQSSLEFLNILPFTPSGGRSNMIGWMGARNDGDKYGKVLVYSFPKNVTVAGPAQIRARVNQDPVLSQQMTLWNARGSELLRGNLLVIPIADSLLYVEAFYLQAEGSQSKMPELRQVAVATQDRLASAKTFEDALRILFPELQTKQPGAPAQPQGQLAVSQAQQNQSAAGQPSTMPQAGDAERLIQQAQQLFSDYERLTAEGKHREAGERLDQLKQTFAELRRRRGGQ
jgi:uncharacterized membrane protein (UPF0182 family)